jgi:6-pyruvoyltetrahydropterin/6-carboxytetrahydropterin synthase
MKVRLIRRYSFPASHRLHSPALSDAENRAIYGKCDNPHGHGHNYEVELTVRGTLGATGRVIDLATLDRISEEQILTPFRHKNLNAEVEAFRAVVPTTENMASEVDRRLRSVWRSVFGSTGPELEKVRISETERNICEITDGI